MNKNIPYQHIGNLPVIVYQYKKMLDEQYSKENMDEPVTTLSPDGVKAALGIFISIVIVSIILFITAVVLLMKFGKTMPTWALIMAILFLVLPIPGGIIVTFILIFSTRNTVGVL